MCDISASQKYVTVFSLVTVGYQVRVITGLREQGVQGVGADSVVPRALE